MPSRQGNAARIADCILWDTAVITHRADLYRPGLPDYIMLLMWGRGLKGLSNVGTVTNGDRTLAAGLGVLALIARPCTWLFRH
jgi:hypothetical protein